MKNKKKEALKNKEGALKNNKRRKRVFGLFQTTVSVIFGNALLAFMVAAFVIPHDIIMGGTTGIGIALNKALSIDTAVLILILNILLLIFGGIVLGKKFFVTTVASSLLYPAMLAVMQRIPGITALTDNGLIASIFGGCLMGLSMGVLMRVGSSTGGMDVVNLVLHKWFHLPVAVFLSITDVIVVGAQAVFAKPEQLLLGIITIVCETLIVEQVMIFGKSQIQVFVVSEQYEVIRKKILNELQAGVTMILIETGCLGQKQEGIMCIIPPRKLHTATELIQSADPNAFITITKIKEVRGRGFTLERQIKNQNRPIYKHEEF